MDELNTLISSMAAEGNVDSSGVFTLDLTHAELKLQDYRLPDPALFILNLVAAAVCSGAHFFQVETERQQTRIFFNGILPHAERLAELFTFILKNSPHPANRELAMALHGATALPGSPKISLTVGTREGAWAGEVEGTRIAVQEVPGGPIGVKVVLQYTSPNPLAQLLGLGGNKSYQRIVDRLWHFCRHAPLDFKINGRSSGSSVSMGLYLDQAPFARRFLQGEQTMRLSKPGTRRHDILFSAARPSPLPSSILVGLADQVTAEREGFLLISRGVVFKRPHALLECKIACAVVTADHLEKDLSQTDLVESEEYAQILEVVRQQLDDLIQEVLVSPPIWNSRQAEDFEMCLMDRYPDSDRRPVAAEAFLRGQRLGESCRGVAGAQEQIAYLTNLQRQKRPEAATFARQLTRVLETRLADTVVNKQWTMVVDFLECLHSLRPLPNDYRLALYCLADQLDRGRLAVIESAPESNSQDALLRYVFGWNAKPPNSSMLSRFFELERAVFKEDRATALLRANELEGATLTPFLGLWLGWFHWGRGDYQRAAALWYQTLSRCGPEVHAIWYPILWAQISGKVSLLTQVRWQARQGYRQLFDGSGAHEESLRSDEDPKILEWCQKVWQLRSQGQHSAAQRLFLTHFLRQALDVRGFSLAPFSSTTLATALPTS